MTDGTMFTTVTRGEDRKLILRLLQNLNCSQEPFSLTDATQIAVAFPGEVSKVEKVLAARAEQWKLKIVLVSSTTAYNGKLNGTAFTFTSDASATLAEIRAGLISAINALVGGVTASNGVQSDEVKVVANVAGSVGAFTLEATTSNLIASLVETGQDVGSPAGIVIVSADGGKIEVNLSDADTERLKIGERMDFEVVVDKTAERRVVRFSKAMTVVDRSPSA